MENYWINETFYPPCCRIAFLYIHAVPSSDGGRRAAQAHGVEVFPSIRGALCLAPDQLNVDGVVVGAESPPVFIDEHFFSDWDESKWIWDQISELGFPLI